MIRSVALALRGDADMNVATAHGEPQAGTRDVQPEAGQGGVRCRLAFLYLGNDRVSEKLLPIRPELFRVV